MAFTLTQNVMFKHCDPAGIVFYPRYFEMVNDCVENFFGDCLGMPFHTMHTTHGVPTISLTANFVAASRHGDVLDFTVTPKRIGGASMDLCVAAQCEGADRIKVDLTVVYVSKAMKPEPWPDAIRSRFPNPTAPLQEELSNG